jgi:hypothetical protein
MTSAQLVPLRAVDLVSVSDITLDDLPETGGRLAYSPCSKSLPTTQTKHSSTASVIHLPYRRKMLGVHTGLEADTVAER